MQTRLRCSLSIFGEQEEDGGQPEVERLSM